MAWILIKYWIRRRLSCDRVLHCREMALDSLSGAISGTVFHFSSHRKQRSSSVSALVLAISPWDSNCPCLGGNPESSLLAPQYTQALLCSLFLPPGRPCLPSFCAFQAIHLPFNNVGNRSLGGQHARGCIRRIRCCLYSFWHRFDTDILLLSQLSWG